VSRRLVLLSGGTGLIGGRVCSDLLGGGDAVRVLTRNPDSVESRADGSLSAVRWNARELPAATLSQCDAVVHLAGEPVFGGRLTPKRRIAIRDSRVASTRAIVDAIARQPADQRPATLVCASAVGFYGDRGDEELTEDSPPGRGFLADVCREWEESAVAAEAHGVRVVRLRIGIVLAKSGGALPQMSLPFRLGLGGRIGSGRQWFPWIHIDDIAALIGRALEDGELAGAVNATAPNPVRNEELTRELGRALHRPTLVPVPAFALQLALGELAGELLGSRRVLPAAALSRGFSFRYPNLEDALAQAL
jgi:uncharacterized protein (TIGR01777 family)